MDVSFRLTNRCYQPVLLCLRLWAREDRILFHYCMCAFTCLESSVSMLFVSLTHTDLAVLNRCDHAAPMLDSEWCRVGTKSRPVDASLQPTGLETRLDA